MQPLRTSTRHFFWIALCFLVTLVAIPALAHTARAGGRVAGRRGWQLVDPFIGTSGTAAGGPIDTFPGASLPFGMIQWSPDTPSEPAGGGYNYTDRVVTGFGLTHLSGPGCSVFGDIDILPEAGPTPEPWDAVQPFSHASERAHPGWYAVTVGNPPIRVRLTVTKRTGLGQFIYPRHIRARMIFKVSSDQAGVTRAHFKVVGTHEVIGDATSGGFCGEPDRFTVYFVARFNRPFDHSGTWSSGITHPGARSVTGAGSGGWVSFPARSRNAIKLKVAISYVSVQGALANLQAEGRTWNLDPVRHAARKDWSRLLGRIAVRGGTNAERVTFYTALYHTLLQPTLFSDVTGAYPGFDGRIHRLPPGQVQYANFSGWDIYRTEIPLLALLVPNRVSAMAESLVRDTRQGGYLPKWSLANGYTGVMGGDSADPILAGAYAFGARKFNTHEALQDMIRGATLTATRPGQGWYIERPGLTSYLKRGYVGHALTTSVAPVPNGASETLEYALDDFSIAEFAKQLGDRTAFRTFFSRSMNWSHLFDRSTGEIAPRNRAGAFLRTPITENGQSGFQEGNAAQYTWMVPEDLAGLIRGLGGRRATLHRLNRYFTHLNAGQSAPYAWLGNEPSLGDPWVYLATLAPWRTQAVIRKAITTLYFPTPAGLPGNDDLGTMSAWYIWSALGLYPQNPSLRILDIGSPLFPHIRLDSPGGLRLIIQAPHAEASRPYVDALTINGHPDQRTWFSLPMRGTLTLGFHLGSRPDHAWGSAPGDAPPSFAPGPIHFPPSTNVQLTRMERQDCVHPGHPIRLAFDLNGAKARHATRIRWSIEVPRGFSVHPDRGVAAVFPGTDLRIPFTLHIPRGTQEGYADVRINARTESGAQLPELLLPLRIESHSDAVIPLVYAVNNADNSVIPINPRTGALGPRIMVGNDPDAAILSPHGRWLYVANQGSNTISVIDTVSQTVATTIAVGSGPDALALNPRGSTLWVANGGSNNIESIATETRKAGPGIPTGVGPAALTLAPSGRVLYVANSGSNTVTPIRLPARRVGPLIRVGLRPSGLAIVPHGNRLYVIDQGANEVTPIDLKDGHALRPIRTGLLPGNPALTRDGRLLYVPNGASNTLSRIATVTGSSLRPLPSGPGPATVAIGPRGRSLYVADGAGGVVTRIDRRSGKIIWSVRTGGLPVFVAAPKIP
ncbi:MAG: GH92 family glycosyl hydrolase [Gammaproteobacteria bacterium]